jgi:dTDP-4-dehydrorhamnose 3,5-epimerase
VEPVSTPIAGVHHLPLREISNGRGSVLHMLRADSPAFTGFGEVYFSEVLPGTVKEWKRHQRMTQRFAVPLGRMRLVVFDDREDSPTRGAVAEYLLGRPEAYALLVLPPRVWYAFQCVSEGPAVMANCADLPHDPAESEQIALEAPGLPGHRFGLSPEPPAIP